MNATQEKIFERKPEEFSEVSKSFYALVLSNITKEKEGRNERKDIIRGNEGEQMMLLRRCCSNGAKFSDRRSNFLMNISFECFIPSLNIIHHVIETTTFTLLERFQVRTTLSSKDRKKNCHFLAVISKMDIAM